MIPFSVLDLSPIIEGGDARQALANTRDLAVQAERLGYRRFWVAEHHNMPGIASAATSLVIAHAAAATSAIRVGAGGIMLPNHAPIQIAEQFGTLEALYPGRIDLGLGRAPGTDQLTMRALRRTLHSDPDAFPQDVLELMAFLRESEPGQRVRAVPGEGSHVPIWILGSSLYGAQVAAALGLPFSFASHFAPAQMMEAIEIYRARFRPSETLAAPYVMLGVSLIAAETEAEAKFLATSQAQAYAALLSGRPTPLKPPLQGFELAPELAAQRPQSSETMIRGDAGKVRAKIEALVAKTGANELILMTQVYDHAARVRSYEIAAAVRAAMEGAR